MKYTINYIFMRIQINLALSEYIELINSENIGAFTVLAN